MIPGLREAQARYDAQEAPGCFDGPEMCDGGCDLELEDCQNGCAGACIRCSECKSLAIVSKYDCCDHAENHYGECPFPSEACRCDAIKAEKKQRALDVVSEQAIDEEREARA